MFELSKKATALIGFWLSVACTTRTPVVLKSPVQTNPSAPALTSKQAKTKVFRKIRSPFYEKAMTHLHHPKVQKWIRYFQQDGFEQFQRFLDRGAPYKDFLESELKKEGLPKELYYLAMIESGFNIGAISRASAVGMWQFMAATGKRYGLRVDRYVDERRHPLKATRAAMRYLQDLHRVYQSWWLAIASYNSGEHRVLRAIMKENTRKYFDLVEEKALPPETRNYVPKFIAALHLGENAGFYGFVVESKAPHDWFTALPVKVPAGVNLADIAKQASCNSKKLKRANPHIRRKLLHRKIQVEVFIPDSCNGSSIRLASLRKIGKKRIETLSRAKRYYKVRRGDSLLRIAHIHGTSLRYIKRANGLRSNRIYPGQKLKLSGTRWLTHKVRRGENLYLIAKKYQTTIYRIKKINHLRRSRIYPGQVIKIALAEGKKKT